MKTISLKILFAVLMLSSSLACGSAAEHVGIVKSMAGEVEIARGDRILKAEPNHKLFEGDIVQTGPNGKAGLILEDDTVISLGYNSKIAIKNFMFQPNEKKLSFIAKIFQGTVSFLSGRISQLAPDQVRIETPHATVGTRGTHVLIRVD